MFVRPNSTENIDFVKLNIFCNYLDLNLGYFLCIRKFLGGVCHTIEKNTSKYENHSCQSYNEFVFMSISSILSSY